MATIKDRIKDLCMQKDITIQKLELELGYSNASIAKANTNMKAEKLKAIADYFGVTMEYLLTGEEDKGVAKHDTLLTDQERELLDIFRYLNNPGELLRYARYLKDGEKANERKALDA